MKSTRSTIFLMLGVSALALSGCGSTGTVGGIDPAIYAADAGTVSTALDAGTTLKSNTNGVNNAAHQQTQADGSGGATDNGTDFAIAKNDAGGYDVTIDGTTTNFTSGELVGSSYIKGALTDNEIKTLFLAAVGDYHQIWGYTHSNVAADTIDNISGVIGTETKAAALEGKANATYTGTASAFATNTTTGNLVLYNGTANLSADFGASTISGSVGGITYMDTASCGSGTCATGAVAGAIAMNETSISGNGFTGALTGSGDLASVNGGYTGKFYGPNGEEVAGTISGTADSFYGSGTDSIIGGFSTVEN